MNNDKEYPSIVYGEYVISPCNNQFNNKVSYWISKANFTIAFYCFSVSSCNEAKKVFENQKNIDSYISMFNERTAL